MICNLTEQQKQNKKLLNACQKVIECGSVLYITRYYSNSFNQINLSFLDRFGREKMMKSQNVILNYGNDFKWKWKRFNPKIVR